LDELFEREVFKPLGMIDSCFHINKDDHERLARFAQASQLPLLTLTPHTCTHAHITAFLRPCALAITSGRPQSDAPLTSMGPLPEYEPPFPPVRYLSHLPMPPPPPQVYEADENETVAPSDLALQRRRCDRTPHHTPAPPPGGISSTTPATSRPSHPTRRPTLRSLPSSCHPNPSLSVPTASPGLL
jgi:hypothetical protein